jgi:hypothetical protein
MVAQLHGRPLMIGFEDQPEGSAETCSCEIFGHDVTADHARVGMGLHPFGHPTIRDEFAQAEPAMDPTDHIYATEWAPEYVPFFVDHQLVKLVEEFTVDHVRGYRRTA